MKPEYPEKAYKTHDVALTNSFNVSIMIPKENLRPRS